MFIIQHHWRTWCSPKCYITAFWQILFTCIKLVFGRILTTKKGYTPTSDVEQKIEQVVTDTCDVDSHWTEVTLTNPKLKYKVGILKCLYIAIRGKTVESPTIYLIPDWFMKYDFKNGFRSLLPITMLICIDLVRDIPLKSAGGRG